MTDQPDTPNKSASDAVAKARAALEMKRAAAGATHREPKGKQRMYERAAAARSASKSKPALRK